MKKYKYRHEYKQKFTEELRLVDLRKHAGMSKFTARWEQERAKLIGRGKKGCTLIEIKVNKKKDYVTFIFKSTPTYIKDNDQDFMGVGFPNVEIIKKVKIYTQQVRILNFFKLLETKPGFKKEKKPLLKDVQEVIEQADVQLSCNCMSFQYQGMNYILNTFNASIYPENRYPERWTNYHHDDNFLCKHLDVLISTAIFNLYIKEMTEMLHRYYVVNIM